MNAGMWRDAGTDAQVANKIVEQLMKAATDECHADESQEQQA